MKQFLLIALIALFSPLAKAEKKECRPFLHVSGEVTQENGSFQGFKDLMSHATALGTQVKIYNYVVTDSFEATKRMGVKSYRFALVLQAFPAPPSLFDPKDELAPIPLKTTAEEIFQEFIKEHQHVPGLKFKTCYSPSPKQSGGVSVIGSN